MVPAIGINIHTEEYGAIQKLKGCASVTVSLSQSIGGVASTLFITNSLLWEDWHVQAIIET